MCQRGMLKSGVVSVPLENSKTSANKGACVVFRTNRVKETGYSVD
jgi:hypothetical protein